MNVIRGSSSTFNAGNANTPNSTQDTMYFVDAINKSSNWIYAIPGDVGQFKAQSPESQPEYRLPLHSGFSVSELSFPQSDPKFLSVIPKIDFH